MIERIKHWIRESRRKHCRHCCIWCEYYDICSSEGCVSDASAQDDNEGEETKK